MLDKTTSLRSSMRKLCRIQSVFFCISPLGWLALQEALLTACRLSFSKPQIAGFQKKKQNQIQIKNKLETEKRKTKWLDTIARSRSFLRTAIYSKSNTRSKPSVKETPPLGSAAPTLSSSASRKNQPSSSKTPGRKHTFA